MTKDNIKKVLGTLAKAGIYCLMMGIPYPLRALVLWEFWKWFLLPIGAPALTYFYSLAIIIISALILVNVHKNQGEHIIPPEDRETAIGNMFSISLETSLRTGLIFLFGLVIHWLGPK